MGTRKVKVLSEACDSLSLPQGERFRTPELSLILAMKFTINACSFVRNCEPLFLSHSSGPVLLHPTFYITLNEPGHILLKLLP